MQERPVWFVRDTFRPRLGAGDDQSVDLAVPERAGIAVFLQKVSLCGAGPRDLGIIIALYLDIQVARARLEEAAKLSLRRADGRVRHVVDESDDDRLDSRLTLSLTGGTGFNGDRNRHKIYPFYKFTRVSHMPA
jgi:hypothetical protein